MIKIMERIQHKSHTLNPIKNSTQAFTSNLLFKITSIAILLTTIYWLLIASDRFVSESHVIIQKTDIASGQVVDISNILSGSGNVAHADQLLLRDYLLSVDMLKKLDAALNLRAHYSNNHHDIFSRMWFEKPSMEIFYKYFLSRVDVQFDDYSGVLVIKAEAYNAKTAHAITSFLVVEGERYMNELAHSLAQDQMNFLEKQLVQNADRANKARQALLTYQNKKGMVSPQSTAENVVGVVAKLESEKSGLETQRSALQAYLVPGHPNVVQINQQIVAIEKQIIQEQSKLTSANGKTLNRTVEEYQRLEMEAGFTNDVYKTTLVALEKVRIDVTRTIKKVSVLQKPTFPEYPLQPRRLYNSIVFALFIVMLAGLAHLLIAVVRDHKD